MPDKKYITKHFLFQVNLYLFPIQPCDRLGKRILRDHITDSASHGYRLFFFSPEQLSKGFYVLLFPNYFYNLIISALMTLKDRSYA